MACFAVRSSRLSNAFVYRIHIRSQRLYFLFQLCLFCTQRLTVNRMGQAKLVQQPLSFLVLFQLISMGGSKALLCALPADGTVLVVHRLQVIDRFVSSQQSVNVTNALFLAAYSGELPC